MTSEQPTEAFVWIWLPDATQPVVARRLTCNADDTSLSFSLWMRANRARRARSPLGSSVPDVQSFGRYRDGV